MDHVQVSKQSVIKQMVNRWNILTGLTMFLPLRRSSELISLELFKLAIDALILTLLFPCLAIR